MTTLQRRRQGGFSLIEMLVALVILLLSLGMLYQAAARSARNVRVDEQYSYAVLMAESLLAQHSAVTVEGVRENGEEQGYRWQLSSTSLAGPQNLAAITLHQVNAEILWGEGDQLRRVNLTTVVPEAIQNER